jgi:uncharacterized protein YdeI (YjbR/CyaY-like superfamily)
MKKEIEKIAIESANELRDWLIQNHDTTESVWLVTWKKGSGRPYVSYDEIVDQCLCFGWIDSIPRKLDEKRKMLRISPRNPKSNWSRANKNRIARLTKEDLMQPSGLALVEKAKEIGTWAFLDDVEDLLVPDDLETEFKKYHHAKNYFDKFPASSKRGILEWIKSAKTDSTRQKRISETAQKADRNLKANHPKGRDSGSREN